MPILSICIPTFNRAEYLALALQSIVETKRFQETNDIEIAVSDNASTDDTPVLMKRYAAEYPKKIKYHRNDVNVHDKNFEIVLSLGTGVFRKLSNDNIIYSEECLAYILDIVRNNETERPLLFFLNGSFHTDFEITKRNTIEDFLNTVSYISTWIGGFGIWDTQLEYVIKYSDYYHTQLIQVKIIYAILNDTYESVIVNKKIFELYPIHNKSSYDVLKVFGYNYINILREYSNAISDTCIEREKKRVLFAHIVPYYCDFRKQRKLADSYSYRYLYKTYKYNWYFYSLLIWIPAYYLYFCMRNIIPQGLRNKIRRMLIK